MPRFLSCELSEGSRKYFSGLPVWGTVSVAEACSSACLATWLTLALESVLLPYKEFMFSFVLALVIWT